ncbi:MAG: excinuclease ABC subunit UvrC [Spirochaetales bacterium]
MKTNNSIYESLHQVALQAPKSGGVYIWSDSEHIVLYIGKAKNLKNRLTSYFSGKKDIKTQMLISRAKSIEYITTANEYEALILENTLIKQHSPRYNINLKDDKSYPVVRITNEDFPRVIKTRRIIQDGSEYFGPFPNGGALITFIDTLYSMYPLRQCKKMPKRKTPCMYYHIGRCAAPCCGKIDKESYSTIIGNVRLILNENPEKAIKKLENAMKEAAQELKFEKAARLRDGLGALKSLRMQNVVSDFNPESRDYIGYYAEGAEVSFVILKMRSGKLVMRDLYRTKTLAKDDELLSEFIMAYYTSEDLIPPRIFVFDKTGLELTEKWLFETHKTDTHINTPQETHELSRHEAALHMATHNAKEDMIRRMRERGDTPALEELKSILNLTHLPIRIEGFDIAHLHGKFPVASLISFYNGQPDKKHYRYFRLKTTNGIIDDFASMREATSRRYTRLLNDQEQMPDLILIDGGIGQVNAVQGVLDSLGLDIPIIGLAKRDEELFLPGNSTPIIVPKRSDALRLLQRVRDETHRFATKLNQRLRTKENTVSIFTQLPHIGKKRATLITQHWTTLENLLSATISDIENILTVSTAQAQDILQSAKFLLQEQKSRTHTQNQSQNRQNVDYVSDLANRALGEQKVAEPETEYNTKPKNKT